METIRQSINEHLASVGEEISCAFEKHICVSQQERVREFVSERHAAAAWFMSDLFQRELEQRLSERQKLLDVLLQPRVLLNRAVVTPEPWVPEETNPEQKTEPLASTSTEADGQACVASSRPPVASSSSSESSSESNGAEDERDRETGEERSTSKTLKPPQNEARPTGSSLNPRMITHACIYICSVCGKRFRQQSKLRRHMMMHTREKPLKCTVCGKRLRYKDSLRLHMMIHDGEKPFGCVVCGKDFVHRGHLNRHMRTHPASTMGI